MKKKIVIILGIIIIFIIILSIILMPKYEVTSEEKERIRKDVLNNIDSLTSEETTLENTKEIIGKDIVNVIVTVGEDSYLRNKPTERVIAKYKLSDMEKEQEELVKKVETRYLNNLNYKIIGEEVDGNKVCESIEIETYYYSLYLYDYIEITNSLLPYDVKDASVDDESALEYYKAQLKALKVLDKHLDDYENKNKEKENVRVCYNKGNIIDENEMLSLTLALQGELYSNMNFDDKENVKITKERIKKYLKEAEEIV